MQQPENKEMFLIDKQLAEAALNLMLEAPVPGKVSLPIIQAFQRLQPYKPEVPRPETKEDDKE
jgi:hypothetical protein